MIELANRLRVRTTSLYVVLAVAIAATAGCAAAEPEVVLEDHRFTVEIADEPEEHAQGLMFRDSMPADHGMLFIFPRSSPRSFWMKNTRIPLDILYFDAQRRLVKAHHNVPPCRSRRCPSYSSKWPAKYVLELNGGTAERIGVDDESRLIMHLEQ